jgi:NAD(P)H-hydrate epimerase
LEALKNESRMEFEARRKNPPIISVDIPSGWDVNEGNPGGRFFTPQVVLSLTAPKVGIRAFTLGGEEMPELAKPGTHFIGGRFISEEMEERFNLALPTYQGDSQIVDVTGFEEMAEEEI